MTAVFVLVNAQAAGDDRTAWQDPERLVMGWIRAGLAPLQKVYGGGEVPNGTAPDFITVERVGGSGTDLDREVDIETTVYATNRADMWQLAAAVEDAMRALAANGPDGGRYVDDVDEAFSFRFDPIQNQSQRRATATWTLTVRPWA